jgi:hypothetical protein
MSSPTSLQIECPVGSMSVTGLPPAYAYGFPSTVEGTGVPPAVSLETNEPVAGLYQRAFHVHQPRHRIGAVTLIAEVLPEVRGNLRAVRAVGREPRQALRGRSGAERTHHAACWSVIVVNAVPPASRPRHRRQPHHRRTARRDRHRAQRHHAHQWRQRLRPLPLHPLAQPPHRIAQAHSPDTEVCSTTALTRYCITVMPILDCRC